MASIRKTKTSSGSIAVQVVRYQHRKVIVEKHIGSARNDDEVKALYEVARTWIEQTTGQISLADVSSSRTLSLANTQYVGVNYLFAYEVLLDVAGRLGLDLDRDRLIIDLAIMRLIEPASKLRSIELLERYFNVRYSRRAIYSVLPSLHERQQELQDVAQRFALEQLDASLSLVLYDVTTLYFESFKADELRVCGFSKENKPSQPQIMLGLLVSRQGFPLAYEIFPGNTFEGKTMVAVLESFVKKHNVERPIVVADAAMLSHNNISELKERGLSYIVGARLGNLSGVMINKVSEGLAQTDQKTKRLKTDRGDLIVGFEEARYRKGLREMNAQLEKAKWLIAHGESGRRAKFVTKEGGSCALNQNLIEKTQKLLGIRGYYTDVPKTVLKDREIIAYYHGLWRVEQAFRMAKSDLAFRPIFHHKQDAIHAHMLVCFVALQITKYIELHTGASTRKTRDLLWSVTDAHFVDQTTGEKFTFRSPISKELSEFQNKLRIP